MSTVDDHPDVYVVTCPDGVCRHAQPFATRVLAREWANYGQICEAASKHRFSTAPGPVVQPGDSFDTHVESGCVVLTASDVFGSFEARDSEGVVCLFSSLMVRNLVPAASVAP